MGVMHELVEAETAVPTEAPDFTEERFEELAKGYHDCKSEVEVKTGLSLIRLYAGVYEGRNPTNGIINVANPWDVRVSWCLTGPLRELICGTWCVSVHFESIGEGREFTLHYPEFEFNCHHKCYSVRLPGRGIRPDDCSTPYKPVVTVAYKTMCGKPGPIIGFCEFPVIQFYDSK